MIARFPIFRQIPRGLLAPVLMGLVLVPTLLGAASWQTHREFERGRELRAAVNHSYEERLQMQTVFSLMQDAETGQRGYVITGQPQFLDPYVHALARLGQERARLRSMQESEQGTAYSSGASELEDLSALDALVGAKLANMRHTIAVRDQAGVAAAEALVRSGEGKRIMDRIRVHMESMSRAEATALQQRIAADAERTLRTERVVFAMFGLLAAFLLAAFALILRQSIQRQKLLTQVETVAARKSAIFESAQDGLVTLNRSGSIETINRASEAMFGYQRTEVVRRDAGILFDLPGEGLFLDRLGEELGAGGAREVTARRADGATFPAEISLGRFNLADGLHLVVAVRDVTERRRVEQLKSEFVSTVSHELRTPLTSIAGSLGLLIGGAAGELPQKAGRLLGIAHANCQRLVRLINDILDIEKIESGQMAFTMAPVEFSVVVRRAVEGMGGLAADLNIRFDLETADDLPLVRGDADRLTQVVANLLSNAAKFSPTGEVVSVRVMAAAAGRVRLSVQDRGPGVPEDFRSRIFSKFAQADGSDTRQKGGTGLGLAICREIAERHGGRVWFDSPPGEGATFHLELPAVSAGAERLAGPRILVCEDDADAAEVLCETLRKEGMSPVAVGSLAAAQQALSDGGYAALLLDMRLPDGHGLQLLGRLRDHPGTATLPVMIVSGEPSEGAVQALGIVDWLQKPVDVDRLKRALAQVVVHHPADERPLVLHVEDDPDVRQIVGDALAHCCNVAAAPSVAAARTLLEGIRPTLAILDLALEDGCGLEVLPELRKAGCAPVPIVVFSAQSLEDERLAASVDAVLVKSRTSLEELGHTVQRLARRPAHKDQPA